MGRAPTPLPALLLALVAGDEALAEARMLVHVQAFETEIMDAFSR